MQESTVYTEGIVIEEFRRGLKIGDKLLRPAMVKVSAGPGPGPASASLDLPLDEALRSDLC
jgi:molecular chaperone GrpE